MGYGAAIKNAIWRIFDYRTRSSRSELWWFVLLYFGGIFGFSMLGQSYPQIHSFQMQDLLAVRSFQDGLLVLIAVLGPLLYIVSLFIVVALSVRRFHDTDKSGWWTLIILAPFGVFIWAILMSRPGTNGPNRFGDDPLGDPMDVFD